MITGGSSSSSSCTSPRRKQVLRVSAPGKVILFGEHSVLYRRLAIAVSVGLRTTLNLFQTAGEVSLDLPDIGLQGCWSAEQVRAWFGPLVNNDWRFPTPASPQLRLQLLQAVHEHIDGELSQQHALALVSFFYLYCSLCPSFPGVHVSVNSQLPTGAGLGSSAAYGVSLVTALLYRYHQVVPSNHEQLSLHTGEEVRPDTATRQLISDWAFASDMLIHGVASGVDNAICTHGGALSFQDSRIEPHEGTHLIQVLLVDTGVPRDTSAMVQLVRNQRADQRLSPVLEPVLNAMHALAESACSALSDGDEPALERLVQMNQGLLTTLGVSHPALDAVCQTAARHGLAAKLTGAGGGGFALVLLRSDTTAGTTTAVKNELEKLGYSVHAMAVGGSGVLIQNLS